MPINSERFAVAACVLLSVAGLWLLVRLIWLVAAGPEVEAARIAPLPTEARIAATVQADWDLFGEAGETSRPAVRPVRATPLNLRLLGAVTGERGYAIIRDADGRESVYRAGDDLPGGARLEAIESRRVILARDGGREALELPEGAGGEVARPRRDSTGADSSDAGGGSAVSAASLPDMTARYLADPQQLAGRISVLPVAGGGFRVRAGRDAELFTALGLHANDVVVSVNGQPLNNEADVMALFQSINPDQRLAITVRRDGREMVLIPDLD